MLSRKGKVNVRIGMIALFSFALIGWFATPLTNAKQDSDQSLPWIHLSIVQVHPTMVNDFIAVQRELMARASDADKPWRTVSRTAVFGDNYRFLIATPGNNLAGFNDEENRDAELSSLMSRLERCITSQQTYAIQTLKDIDNPLPPDEEPGVMIVNLSKVVPGREQEYYDVMATDFFPHFDEAEMHHVTGSMALGGDGGYIHVFYLENFGSLDQGSPVIRALGPEGAQKINKKLSGIVTSTEQWIMRLIPELSYGPWSPEKGTGREGEKSLKSNQK